MGAETVLKVLDSTSLMFQNPFEFNDIFEGMFNVEKLLRPRNSGVPISFGEIEPTLSKCKTDLAVTCFSEIKDNYLMWAHYADNYKGISLEFDFKQTEFFDSKGLGYERKARYERVNYATEFPKVVFHEEFLDWTYIQKQVKDALFTKSLDWAYEKEVRLLLSEAKGLKAFNPNCLKKVIFGPRCSNELVEQIKARIIQFNSDNGVDVSYEHAVISGSSYRMEFSEGPKTKTHDQLSFRVAGVEMCDSPPELIISPFDEKLDQDIKNNT